MWKLINVQAQNICVFKEMDFSPKQGYTTLIFGQNRDDDSQGSNGSGKSALIEAIAVGLSGDPLRKVKSDEIINDGAEEAKVILTLTNDERNETLKIERTYSRTNPQQIKVTINGEDIPQPSVIEYNRFILDIIGISRDDLFSNFILSKHKYNSFLNATDKDKKELINRFSNGILVDQARNKLSSDLDSSRSKLRHADVDLANASGYVNAIKEQISLAIADNEARAERKEEILKAHEEAIVNQRAKIRQTNERIELIKSVVDRYEATLDELQEIEDNPTTFANMNKDVIEAIKKAGLTPGHDYNDLIVEYQGQYNRFRSMAEASNVELGNYEHEQRKAAERYDNLKDEYEILKASNIPQLVVLKSELERLEIQTDRVKNEQNEIAAQLELYSEKVVKCKTMLAGEITCPNCLHKFFNRQKKTPQEVRDKLADTRKKIHNAEKRKEIVAEKLKEIASQIAHDQDEQQSIMESVRAFGEKVQKASEEITRLSSLVAETKRELLEERSKADEFEQKLNNMIKVLFDEAYETVGIAKRACERDIEAAEIDIVTYNANIESYKEAIEETKATTLDSIVDSLQKKLDEYAEKFDEIKAAKDKAEKEYNEFVVQDARFVEFQTHLANSKIAALSLMTNEFLEAIGSDLRIVFNGYTILKSGKIRDKISVSVVRNGIDCGSFAKMSQGEQCRVNLASILALHKLTNVDCQDGKGLDLLILDEILDATDEAGLASMFEALNNLHITAMVVSHGLTQENYPYKLFVTKSNGVSTLNDC